jgi:CRISPR-associated endonuclease/helicase Cas3
MSASMGLKPADFVPFFTELHGHEPFPWQRRLAERVCAGDWPRCIALPTAAGKTACIDIAVFAMAVQANRPVPERTAPRRVFFVVDRRVVVDQAYEHAKKLAKELGISTGGVLKKVADALRSLDQSDRPLDFYALRGGMYRESAWVRSPLQPTVITSTVDQVGSRLLFRGYGVSDSLKPLHAALVGNDALILLDEAHCSKPFGQTMTLVEKYRGWSNEGLRTPFRFVSMTATPADTMPDDQIERDREDDHAHPVLGPRIRAGKPARLVVTAKTTGKTKWRAELVKELAKQAHGLAERGFKAVGVIVNRVATARDLKQELGSDAVLVTGRMRPMDRDKLFEERLRPLLSRAAGTPPQFVVATQCLEVGADFDFHALVTECASLDALRQRFGRLNRVAARPEAEAVVVVRADQAVPAEGDDADPVYGNSLAHTWAWLNQNASGGVFDFGVAAVRAKTQGMPPKELARLIAPAPDAAVLLPAHLDMWCQTSPIPAPDPDPAVFLHGPRSGMPDVQVVFRADLGEDREKWADIVSLCPPSSSEVLPVRLDVFKRWIAGDKTADESGDVEGEATATGGDEEPADARHALRWRGADSDRTAVIGSPSELRPGDLFVIPIDQTNADQLGDFPEKPVTDQGDEAFQRARDLPILRLTQDGARALEEKSIEDDDDLTAEITDLITTFAGADQPEWKQRAAKALNKPSKRVVKPHPLGGFVVVGKRRLKRFDPTFIEAAESWDSTGVGPVLLDKHCAKVAENARQFAEHLGLSVHAEALDRAGLLHDAGKADPRFQAWLHGGNQRRAEAFPRPLAKSLVPMPSRVDRSAARDRAGYPKGARHELLSVRLAECDGVLPAERDVRDLVLHLIASHHGNCRPFAPVVDDPQPVYASIHVDGKALKASSDTKLERLDSGVAERFWMLTRRFGWWGLPWLEALLRLADWAASEAAANKENADGQ